MRFINVQINVQDIIDWTSKISTDNEGSIFINNVKKGLNPGLELSKSIYLKGSSLVHHVCSHFNAMKCPF